MWYEPGHEQSKHHKLLQNSRTIGLSLGLKSLNVLTPSVDKWPKYVHDPMDLYLGSLL